MVYHWDGGKSHFVKRKRLLHGVRGQHDELLLCRRRHRQGRLLLQLLMCVLLRLRDQLLGRHGHGAGALRADGRLGEGDSEMRGFGQLVVVSSLQITSKKQSGWRSATRNHEQDSSQPPIDAQPTP